MRSSNKLTCGVGINDADYSVNVSEKINGKYVKTFRCKYHECWRNILERCYRVSNKSYVDCYVTPEWLYFSKFKAWMETQDWVGKQIDKDLLINGNKCYSPDTCVFISPQLNKFLQDAFSNKREGGVKGYYFDKRYGKFVAQCSDHITGKLKHLGSFADEAEAHAAWKAFKHKQAIAFAEKESNPKIVEAILNKFKP
jgi:hypothetical protein